MQFCRSRLFVPVERYLWRTERYIRGKQAWFLQLKLCFNSFCRLKNIWTTSVSQHPRKVSCSLRFSGFTWGESLTIPQQQTFPLFISEWYITKNHEIGSLAVRKVEKSRASWAWTSLGVAEQCNCWSFCHVYCLDDPSQKASKVHKLLSQSWP